jgi:hypothetical protein
VCVRVCVEGKWVELKGKSNLHRSRGTMSSKKLFRTSVWSEKSVSEGVWRGKRAEKSNNTHTEDADGLLGPFPFPKGHFSNGNCVENGVARDLRKDSVLVCELVCAVEGDKELAAVVVGACARHPHNPTVVEPQSLVELVLNL